MVLHLGGESEGEEEQEDFGRRTHGLSHLRTNNLEIFKHILEF